MGLFSNKKTQADGFSFAVDEVYALKEGKTYLKIQKLIYKGRIYPSA